MRVEVGDDEVGAEGLRPGQALAAAAFATDPLRLLRHPPDAEAQLKR
jgi:hypothetical protein